LGEGWSAIYHVGLRMDKTIVDTRNPDLKGDDAIIDEAHSRFQTVDSFEAANRDEAREDLRMLAGKDHWPGSIVRNRELTERPCLTVNKLPSFVDQVINDARLNKTSIKVRPSGGGSTEQVAQTIQGMIRNIEVVSDSDIAYQTALEGSVNNGFGYFRIDSEYAGDSTFEQEIYIRRIRNPLSVYFDNQTQEPDGRDARFVFIVEKISRKEMKARYGVEASPFSAEMSNGSQLWIEEDMVQVAEYWTKEPVTKRLGLLSDGRTVDLDQWDKIVDELQEIAAGDPDAKEVPTVTRTRDVKTHKVVQYLIGGDKVISRTDWPGRYIPIVRVLGKEIVVDDEVFIRGLIRFAKDPQRMYNYFRTAATETVALAPKAPYIMEERQIEGHEEEWSSVGRTNLPYLLYKAVSGVGAPERNVVTQTAIGEMTESNLANDEIKATTSLFDASLGAQSNEVSGRAILARQREGDVANFIYHDNLRRGVKFCGDILVDLIPKIYDTERQVLIMDEMEREKMVSVNQEVFDDESGENVLVNDLSMGRYKIVVTTGPSFTTQRVEAAESMLDFVRTAPDTASLVMDLIAENQDWPGAQKIANRLRKLLPPGIDDEGPPQPQPPSIDEIIKRLKANSIELGNLKKKLDIVEQRRELDGHEQGVAEAGASGALQALGFGQQGGTE